MCCGYPDRIDVEDYPKAPLDSYWKIANTLDESSVMAVSLEDAHRHNDLKLLEEFSNTTVLLGVVAIAKVRLKVPRKSVPVSNRHWNTLNLPG